jgi:hypothetical protein
VYEGLQVPFDTALRIESRYFAKIVRSPEAAAMIRSLFVSMQDLNKGARRPEGVPPSTIRKIGVLGAGFMGAGIAYVSAQAGIDVVLIDRDQAAADKGKAYSARLIGDQVKKGRAKQEDADALLARITATPDYEQLKGVDLVIEAVFEDRKVKAEATAKAQAVVGKKVVFGSNTSTLPISSLAQDSQDRGQRLARLLHLARGRHLYPRRPSDADRRRARRDDRECRPHGRHAGRPALAQRRGRRRSRLEDPESHRSRSRRGCDRPAAEDAAARDGREARALRAQERQGLLRLSAERPEAALAGTG